MEDTTIGPDENACLAVEQSLQGYKDICLTETARLASRANAWQQ